MTYEFSILREEIKILIKQLHKEIEIFATAHADIGDLYRFLEAFHDFVSLVVVVGIVKVAGKVYGFALVVFLEKFRAIGDTVCNKSVIVISTETADIIKCRNDQVDCLELSV